MTTTADDLRQATDAVALLGSVFAENKALADAEVLAGQRPIAAARRLLDTRSARMAATIARRSRLEPGHSGLAAQQGFLSPQALIQKVTGSTKNDAFKLVAVGSMMASTLNADHVFKLARRMRDRLDEAGIAAREKQAYDDRFLKVYRLGNGKVRLNGLFAPEDGEFVLSVFDSVTDPRRGGVRFVDKEKAAWAKRLQDDSRSTDQIAADAFVQLLKIAGEADQGRVFGGRRPSV
ncbi:DUF222 domain-containing protein [Cryobacterium sp. TMT1-62]|uniref:DUF222 domain-containing protein n=1 Tax=unclassified Cryobacterium TaxID=2649013 RepID=UPI00106A1DFA|nr:MULTISPECIES: DUF222 domain-containing protein [unclassified Cryobacterium]TFB53350.1 DUF222 domain-containing protein [Cryobacterium sp. Sr3]TFC51432.1 DUF222 domain-containing protein [Cryobacterium sp. TMT2-17-1]TFD36796.1 DUF222 domain-containing protein [Cryobacterium sp. TMT1-62]